MQKLDRENKGEQTEDAKSLKSRERKRKKRAGETQNHDVKKEANSIPTRPLNAQPPLEPLICKETRGNHGHNLDITDRQPNKEPTVPAL